MSLGFAHPWVLWALPLALLPLAQARSSPIVLPWLTLVPVDLVSRYLNLLLRALAVCAIAAMVIALAGPYRSRAPVQHIGQGAEIVVLLDRSRSMDQPYAGSPNTTWWTAKAETKSTVAQQLLAKFTASRGHDRIGMVVFSTLPIPVMSLTPHPDVVQAAITAGGIGHGLAETDVGSGLLATLSYFENRPYTGARIILLVSDGGSNIDFETGVRVARLMKRERVTLYWLYLRSYGSPGLLPAERLVRSGFDTVPEHALQRFFTEMGTPYRAYEAENPDALKGAIDDVNRLANLPIRYSELLPRVDRAPALYALALVCSVVLFVAKVVESRRWS